jgi:hypothetical protein
MAVTGRSFRVDLSERLKHHVLYLFHQDRQESGLGRPRRLSCQGRDRTFVRENDGGKTMEVAFRVEDPDAFNGPWSAIKPSRNRADVRGGLGLEQPALVIIVR